MRYARFLIVALVVAGSFVFWQGQQAYAAFHCMRIHAVMAGFNSIGNIQYVELRMNAAGQAVVATHQIKFYNSTGALRATFTFPGNVTNSSTGESILIGTSEFDAATNGGADFVFSSANTVGAGGGDPLHPVQGPAGKVTFAETFANCQAGGPLVVDSVAYGGLGYTGAVDYGSAAVALPSPSNNQALRVGNLALEPTNNSAEYSLQAVSATTFSVPSANLATDLTTPRNNGRAVSQINASKVGGIAESPDVVPSPLAEGGSSGPDAGLLAGVAAAAVAGVVALSGGLWYARRRVARRR